jgi:hypothetical protein
VTPPPLAESAGAHYTLVSDEYMLSGYHSTDEVSGDLPFEAGAVLPPQFYGARRGMAAAEPIKRLMFAMLVDAIRCFQTKCEARQPAKRQEWAEVRSWIFSDEDNEMLSFRAVCDSLQIDPILVRKWLLRWQSMRLAGEQPRKVRRPVITTTKCVSR